MNYSDLISGFEQQQIEESLRQKADYVLARYGADEEAKKITLIRNKFSIMMQNLRTHFGSYKNG